MEKGSKEINKLQKLREKLFNNLSKVIVGKPGVFLVIATQNPIGYGRNYRILGLSNLLHNFFDHFTYSIHTNKINGIPNFIR